MHSNAPVGLTFNVQRFSTEDGPGIRTTVFFKGCPLRCVWCHNPEGMRAQPDLVWYDVRCIGARECLKACPENALELTAQGMRIDRQRCTIGTPYPLFGVGTPYPLFGVGTPYPLLGVCGACARACPAAALEVIGRRWTVDELLLELLKDQAFYETSAGGITCSGGEPMLQAEFLGELLPRCREAGLHMALDTCGAVSWERYERVLPWVNLVLLDLKIMEGAGHQAATGIHNEIILSNARQMAARGIPMWIRTPVIPGYTDDLANIQAIGAFIRDELVTVGRWDLLAYTNLGRPKYHRLDLPYALADAPLLARAKMESLWQAAVELVPTAKWSGVTRD